MSWRRFPRELGVCVRSVRLDLSDHHNKTVQVLGFLWAELAITLRVRQEVPDIGCGQERHGWQQGKACTEQVGSNEQQRFLLGGVLHLVR
eukprot:3958345-Amphidinium_carterae.1